MEILDAFQNPRTLSATARYLGIVGQKNKQYFQSLLIPLINALFLVDASDMSVDEQRSLRTIINSNYFVRPEITFAHCPGVNVDHTQFSWTNYN